MKPGYRKMRGVDFIWRMGDDSTEDIFPVLSHVWYRSPIYANQILGIRLAVVADSYANNQPQQRAH